MYIKGTAFYQEFSMYNKGCCILSMVSWSFCYQQMAAFFGANHSNGWIYYHAYHLVQTLINPFADDTFVALSKFKAFADDNLNKRVPKIAKLYLI